LRLKTLLLASMFAAILLSSSFLAIWIFSADEADASPEFFVGVQLGDGNLDDCKAMVDKVKDYTNLFVLSSSFVTQFEDTLNEACDYIYEAGLYFIVYFQTTAASYEFLPFNWAILAKERYGDKFLGEYFFDEPGGKQVDRAFPMLTMDADNYQDAAEKFVEKVQPDLEYFMNVGGKEFTSDYALYWFDYEVGYDAVLTQFGWNHSRLLHVALCRGAAKVQNREWGVSVTYTYENPPYLESGDELYDDLVLAYHNGAKYAVIFNYDENAAYSGYGILTEEHFVALENFWNYMSNNPTKHGSLSGDVAFVLPEDYGFGLRSPDDSVWGLYGRDNWKQVIWDDVNDLLDEYGSRLDIVYSDPEFNDKLEDYYSEVIFWGIEDFSSYPVQNLNNSLGYNTIQEAISCGLTFDGHVIFVKAGTYQENLLVDKAVTLIGEDRKTTIIDGGNVGTAVTITGKYDPVFSENVVRNVTITGFTIRNGKFQSGEADSSNSMLAAGIEIINANNCSIIGNDIMANGYGIVLNSSWNNKFRDNSLENNSVNFWIDGSWISHFVNDIDDSNMVDGKKMHYLVNENDLVIDSSAFWDTGFLALVNCTGITVQNLNLDGIGQGILMAYTKDSTLSNNTVANNYEGIRLVSSSDNVFRNNRMNNNKYNFWVQDGLKNDIDASNTVNNKPVYYWVNQQDRAVPSDAGYVALVNCTNILVQNLNLSGNRHGILLASTKNSTIAENQITESHDGIWLDECSEINIAGNGITANARGVYLEYCSNLSIQENTVTENGLGLLFYECLNSIAHGNNIENNLGSGIVLNSSSNNRIDGNNIANNEYGIRIDISYFVYSSTGEYITRIVGNSITANLCGIRMEGYESGVTAYHNNFVNNTNHVLDESHTIYGERPTKTWDNDVEGNYWSDYVGTDTNHDGIGDTQYMITRSGVDYIIESPEGEIISGEVTEILVIDRHPLIGIFSSFRAPSGHTFSVISNSTIESIQYFEAESTLKIQVSGEHDGFCRISIPHTSMDVNRISVVIDDGLVPVLNPNYLLHDDGTTRQIYFAYAPSPHEIQITAP